MKRFLTFAVILILVTIAIMLGMENNQVITVNYLLAQGEVNLSALIAIVFLAGFLFASCVASFFYLKLRISHGRLKKINEKQDKALNNALDATNTLPEKA